MFKRIQVLIRHTENRRALAGIGQPFLAYPDQGCLTRHLFAKTELRTDRAPVVKQNR